MLLKSGLSSLYIGIHLGLRLAIKVLSRLVMCGLLVLAGILLELGKQGLEHLVVCWLTWVRSLQT